MKYLLFPIYLILASFIVVYTPKGVQTAGRDNNMALGNPSNADSLDKNNYLIIKDQYVLSYNSDKGIPNWVSWHLSTAWKGNAPRKDKFRADNTLPIGLSRITKQDYNNSGFDRGHMCPSDDRDGSVKDNSMTFLMCNMIPQAPNNNQRTWKALEDYCRKLTNENYELYIIAGGYGQGGTGKNGFKQSISKGKIQVPAHVWKVILVLENGNDDLSRITSKTRVIAVDTPNNQIVSDKNWSFYRLPVDSIESRTGFDFFSNLPKSLQSKLESKTDDILIK